MHNVNTMLENGPFIAAMFLQKDADAVFCLVKESQAVRSFVSTRVKINTKDTEEVRQVYYFPVV